MLHGAALMAKQAVQGNTPLCEAVVVHIDQV